MWLFLKVSVLKPIIEKAAKTINVIIYCISLAYINPNKGLKWLLFF